jgi:hypothetical protein
MNLASATRLALLLLLAARLDAADLPPLIQNARVTVWDVPAGAPAPATSAAHDVVTFVIRGNADKPDGSAVYRAKGAAPRPVPADARTIVIELQNAKVPPLPNTSGHPLAFPRPGSTKLLENERVVVWSFTWTPGVATPMHFHDKDVVVTYLADGALTSTDAQGKAVVNEHHFGYTKFNPRDRVHTERLARGQGSALMVELK